MKNKLRCDWVKLTNPLYIKYHDEEWGVPVHNDNKIFEFLVLESFQAGLSWETVLNKRENFRKAFANFDPKKVANFSVGDFERLINDAGIIRNKLKISGAINNAAKFLAVQKEFKSFDKYIWSFINDKTIVNKWKEDSHIPAATEISIIIAKDLKQRGFKFLGPTVIYAHMQATGMVNDHMLKCFRYKEV